jgi:hypothetical protein
MKYPWIWLFLIANCVSAQSIISGKITDDKHQSLPYINITLHEPHSLAIAAFVITDAEGKYIVKYASKTDSIQLKFYGLGFAAQTKTVANRSQEINVELQEKHTELKEVVIRETPITRRGDTLSYSVNAFKTQSDRAIGDLIRRLPGIEVDAMGKISYQGKPINKYYIEGLDLLGGRYSLANENLPVDGVSQVQVIENHQPIRILDSLVISENAAINIRLRNNVATTGTARFGLGGIPLLWEANITPMLFTKQQQLIASYQSNNIGNTIETQVKVLTIEDALNSFESEERKKTWVRIIPVETPVFSTARWLYNQPHLGSVNFLKKLAAGYELKLNVSYLKDNQRQTGNTQTVNYTPTDTIRFAENKRNHLVINLLETDITLEKNNKIAYFKNQLTLNKQWDRATGILTNNNSPVYQGVVGNYFSLTNQLKDIFKVKKQVITLQSFLNFQQSPQTLEMMPGQFSGLFTIANAFDSLAQRVALRSFITHNRVSMRKNVKGISLSPQMGFRIENRQLQSQIRSISTNSEAILATGNFMNHLEWKKAELYSKMQAQYWIRKWKTTLDLPLTYYRFVIRDTLLKQSQRVERLAFEPRLNVGFEAGSFWKLSGVAERKYSFGDIDDIFYGYLLRDYRSIERRNVPLSQVILWRGSLNVNYQNPLHAVFGFLMFSKTWSDYNLMYASRLSAKGVVESYALPIQNSGITQNVVGRISKYFKVIKSQISLNYQKTTIQRQQLLNNVSLPLNTGLRSWGLKADINPSKKLAIYYDFKASKTHIEIAGKKNPPASQERHQFGVSVFPSRQIYLGLTNDYYINHLQTKSINSIFSDLTFRYTLLKKKIDVETNWTNLWNTSDLTVVSANSFSYFESTYQLRPMQIIQKIRFSF